MAVLKNILPYALCVLLIAAFVCAVSAFVALIIGKIVGSLLVATVLSKVALGLTAAILLTFIPTVLFCLFE